MNTTAPVQTTPAPVPMFLLSTLQPIGNSIPVSSILGYEIVEDTYYLKVRGDGEPTLKKLPPHPDIINQIQAFGIPEA